MALHGSTNKAIGHGYKVVVLRKGEKIQDLITGFLQARKVVGRPCDIMKLDANSFLFTDDHSGIVYLVRKKGTSTNIAVSDEENSSPPAAAVTQTPVPESPRVCLSVILLLTGAMLKAIS